MRGYVTGNGGRAGLTLCPFPPRSADLFTIMRTLELDVVVTRGSEIESRHSVHAAVIAENDELVAAARDPRIVSSWRSCAKPFQAMPFLEAGGFDELHWGDDQLALACASHGGEPEHVALAQAMLADVGLEEGDLACGPHDPISPRGLKLLRESGARLSRLHNNCSGKHAAMLARAHTAGWPTYGYERRDHPVQRCCLQASAKWAGVDEDDIGQAVDGCGVVAFSLALRQHGARMVAARPVHRSTPAPSPAASCTRWRRARFSSVVRSGSIPC